MSELTKKLGAGLVALALGSAVVVSGVATATPAQAHGWGHGHGWGHSWGFYGYPRFYYGGYGGCYLKKFVTYDGDIVFKKVCY